MDEYYGFNDFAGERAENGHVYFLFRRFYKTFILWHARPRVSLARRRNEDVKKGEKRVGHILCTGPRRNFHRRRLSRLSVPTTWTTAKSRLRAESSIVLYADFQIVRHCRAYVVTDEKFNFRDKQPRSCRKYARKR